MNETMQNLIQRRSTKAYLDTPVPEELLDKVLEAGLYAPTGRNNQDVICVAVTNKEIRDQLLAMPNDLHTFCCAPHSCLNIQAQRF